MNVDRSPQPPALSERWQLILLGAMVAVLFFVTLGARDLWNPNEPIYGLAVREMYEAGEWQVPTVNGQVFAEKPILYYWGVLGAAHLLGGVDEFTLRVPSALATWFAVFLVYLWAKPYVRHRQALWAAGIFATTFIVFWSARNIQMDVLVLITTLGALIPLGRMLDHGLSPWRAWTLAGVALGFGLLGKGPVTLVLPGIVFFLHSLSLRRSPLATWRPMLLGGLVTALVASPWYLALWLSGRTDVLFEVLIRQNFMRFTDAWDHVQPWWYYLEYFWIDMAPWSWFVPLGIALQSRSEGEGQLHRVAWLWICGVIFFFSLSESKRAPYILPIAPAVAVLAAEVFDRLATGTLVGRRRRIGEAIYGGLGVLFLLLGAFTAVLPSTGHPFFERLDGSESLAYVLALTFAGLGFLWLVSLWKSRAEASHLVPVLGMGVAGFYLVAVVVILPQLNPLKSARTFCKALEQHVGTDAESSADLRSYRFWDWRSGYPYYCVRTIPNLDSPAQARSYWNVDSQGFLLVEGEYLPEASQVLGLGEPVLHQRIGSRNAYLFSRQAEVDQAMLDQAQVDLAQ